MDNPRYYNCDLLPSSVVAVALLLRATPLLLFTATCENKEGGGGGQLITGAYSLMSLKF